MLLILIFIIFLQEHLSLKNNSLAKLSSGVTNLPCLRSLNARSNHLTHDGVSGNIFELEDLTTLDFSKNNLTAVPDGLENARSLLVLNLSENQ